MQALHLSRSVLPVRHQCSAPSCLGRGAQHARHRRAARMSVCRAERGTEGTPAQAEQQVPPWLQDLERELGVRVIHEAEAPKPVEELEDEEEDWDEVMAALENPWVMEEGDDDDEGEDLDDLPSTLPANMSSGARTAGEASSSSATEGQPQALQSETPQAQPQTPQPPGFEHLVGPQQLGELTSSVPGLIVLDVGERPGSAEAAESHVSTQGQSMHGPGGSRTAAHESNQVQSVDVGEGLGSAAAHESTQGQVVHVPIGELTGSRARDIAAAPAVVVVNGPDHRALQACLRLSRVYRAQSVFLWSPE